VFVAETIYLGNFSEHKVLPVEESRDQFGSWEEASQVGKKALKALLAIWD
jgi:hypothetical protein